MRYTCALAGNKSVNGNLARAHEMEYFVDDDVDGFNWFEV